MQNKICSKCQKVMPFLIEFPSKDGGIICQDCYSKELEETSKQKIADKKIMFQAIYGAMISVNSLSEQETYDIANYCLELFKKDYSIK